MPHFLNALEALTSSLIPIRNLPQGLEFDSEEAALIDVNKQQKAFFPPRILQELIFHLGFAALIYWLQNYNSAVQ